MNAITKCDIQIGKNDSFFKCPFNFYFLHSSLPQTHRMVKENTIQNVRIVQQRVSILVLADTD